MKKSVCGACGGSSFEDLGKLPASLKHRLKCRSCQAVVIGMFIPYPQPNSSNNKKKNSIGESVDKLKAKKKTNVWLFLNGIDEELKLKKCPGCGEESCHYKGIIAVECLNPSCRHYKPPRKNKLKKEIKDDFDFEDFMKSDDNLDF